jgi:hypothetical protein
MDRKPDDMSGFRPINWSGARKCAGAGDLELAG